MEFGYSADWHLSAYSQDKINKESKLTETLHQIITSLNNMIECCLKKGITTIVVGGDLLHGKSIIYAIAQASLLDLFRKYPKIKFIVIDGNHDKSSRGNNSVSALKSIDNEPNVFRIKEKFYKDEKNDILYVPYSVDMIDIIKNNSAKYLVSHFGLNEAKLNSGISVIADIALKDLYGKYDVVLLGHYHKNQEIINDKIKLYYVGSPIQLDWGEKHEEKRFLIINTEKDTIESIPTTGYKKHFLLDITKENQKEVQEEARKLKEEGHLVNLKKIEDFDTDEISKEFKVVDRVEKDVTNRGITTTMTTADKLKKYMDIRGIPEEKQGKYMKVALDIIDSCNQGVS